MPASIIKWYPAGFRQLAGTVVAITFGMTANLPGLMLAAAISIPQAGPPAPPQPQQTTPGKTLTLTGCVQPVPSDTNYFTLSDRATGTRYRLTGRNVKSYVWRNVRIIGGLVPTANIAAQAGSIDPTRAAMVNENGSRPGPEGVPAVELNVLRVRATSGSCGPAAK